MQDQILLRPEMAGTLLKKKSKNQYEGQVFVYFVKAAFGCITFALH